ncbi:glycosyltransferase family 4 protein [uncultured Polaribacter sp.]|uniref:glycosyltransferase family 4 protein n=1 Tax=uncultured Polaribacter sp. TaxID=174711 RepID=UPI00259B624F|nr:glycosyltransferase family 4 protein [uncultured Polaribacter sp.]
MKRVVIFTNIYKPSLGGVQTVTSQLAEWSHKDYKVKVYTNKNPFKVPFFQNIANVPVYRFVLGNVYDDVKSFKGIIMRFLSYLLTPFTFVHLFILFLLHRPHVVNIHFPLHQIRYVIWLKKILGFKLVVSFHGYDVLQWQNKEKNSLFKDQLSILHKAASITACSKYLAFEVENIFKIEVNSVQHVYNGVNIKTFESIEESEAFEPFIFTFGRLEKDKGFDLLINAFAKLNRNNLKLYIAGNGSKEKELHKLAKELKIDERVVFLGRIRQDEIAKFSCKAKINVIPSRRESFGIVVLEALASKRPLLATNVGGIPEIVRPGFGVMVDPKVDDLLNGIKAVLNLDKKIDEAELQTYLKTFSLENMIKNYSKLW